jgi:hypothetical protein
MAQKDYTVESVNVFEDLEGVGFSSRSTRRFLTRPTRAVSGATWQRRGDRRKAAFPRDEPGSGHRRLSASENLKAVVGTQAGDFITVLVAATAGTSQGLQPAAA